MANRQARLLSVSRPLRIPVGHVLPQPLSSPMVVGATRVSDAGTRRASTAAGTASRFGISGSNSHSLAAKRAAEQLAASRREALELRTRLERAERRNADLELSRGEGARREPAERSPVGTTEKDDDALSMALTEPPPATKTPRAPRSEEPALLELARARLRIEDLREENDELRRFARSVAGADPLSSRDAERSDADADADAEKKIASRLFFHDENGGAAATAREARRLEAVVSATTRRIHIDRSDDADDDMDDDMDDEDDDARTQTRRDVDLDEVDVSGVQSSSRDDENKTTSTPSTEETASLRRALAALRAELRTQAHARAILEEERDAFVKRIAEKEEAVRASAAREATSAASLRAARRDALAAAALGEELARSCAEKLERAEAVARAWEQEARRLGNIERANAERRVLAAAEKAEAAAVESRTKKTSFTSPRLERRRETESLVVPPSPPPSATLWGRPAEKENPPQTTDSRDSPFADSAIFADASAGKARVPPSPLSVSDKKGTPSTSVVLPHVVAPSPKRLFDGVARGEGGNEKENEAVPSTPGEALAASLRRQSATLDALRGARSRRDDELRRVRDRLDRLVASPRRVGYHRGMTNVASPSSFSGGETMSMSARRYDASSPSASRRLTGGFSNDEGRRGRRGYDRYADPTPDPASARRAEEEALEAYERAKRDTRRAEFLANEAAIAEKRFVNGRAVPTHPSRAISAVSDPESEGKEEKKSLFSMPSMSMPSMPSFGAPLAAMNKAASTIQSAWRRKKKK